MINDINTIKQHLLNEIYKNGLIRPYNVNLFEYFSEYPKKLVKTAVQELINDGNVFATGLENRRRDFFYTGFTAFLTDKGILEYENYDFGEEKFSIEIVRFLEVIDAADEGVLNVGDIIPRMVSKGSKRAEDYLKSLILNSVSYTCEVKKIWGVGDSQWSVMNVRVDYDTITEFGKHVLKIYQSVLEEKSPKEILKYPYPESDEVIDMRLKTNFNTVSPIYWVDSSGMKFDNDQKDFYGSIPGTSIRTTLRGTGFWVEDGKYYDPAVENFVEATLVRFDEAKIHAKFQHDVALSFAGEDRAIVEKIAEELRENDVEVFYDKFYKAELWGKDLSDHFKDIYGGKTTRYVIIFISKHYIIKDWTNFEFEIAKEEAKKRKEEFILPVKLDDTVIHGISRNIAFLDFADEGLEGIVEAILEKLEK